MDLNILFYFIYLINGEKNIEFLISIKLFMLNKGKKMFAWLKKQLKSEEDINVVGKYDKTYKDFVATYDSDYRKIVSEFQKCNCKKDFEKLIEDNKFLKLNEKHFKWLVDEKKNCVLGLYGRYVKYFFDDKYEKLFSEFLSKVIENVVRFYNWQGYYVSEDFYTARQEWKQKIVGWNDDFIEKNNSFIAMAGESKKQYFIYNHTEIDLSNLFWEEKEQYYLFINDWKYLLEQIIKKSDGEIDKFEDIKIYMNFVAGEPLNVGKIDDVSLKKNNPFYNILEYLFQFSGCYNLNLQELHKSMWDAALEKSFVKDFKFYENYKKIYSNIGNCIALYGSLGLSVILICLCCIYYYISGNKNLLIMYSLIAIKSILFVVGWIGFRNINQNKLFREEYHHKNNIMELFKIFREDENEIIREKITTIMLDTVNDNPNDKIIKRSKESEKVFNERLKNLAEIIKLMDKKV
jgi:hypothetical protein